MRFCLRISAGKYAGREIPVRGPSFIIGCADNCHLKVQATHVNPHHCELITREDGIWVRDGGGGTIVNGTRIVDRRRLIQGDQLQIGTLHFDLLVEDAPLKGNNQAPDEGEILDILSRPVECPVAPEPEPSDLGMARAESPEPPPAAQAESEEEAGTADLALDTLNKLYKTKTSFKSVSREIAAPSISRPKESAAATLDAAPQEIFDPGASISAPPHRVIVLPKWLFMADGRLNPNVMFALGVWVGIGLCSAAVTFWNVFGR